MSVVFDAGDVDLMVSAINNRPDTKAALAAAERSAHRASLNADAEEMLDGDIGKAAYYRDYAKAMRLAIRIAQWQSYTPPPQPKPGSQPRLDASAIKASVDLVTYIDKHVRLVKAGHDRFVGLCPFHDDRRPSMSVWTDGRWKCFACGAGGDIIEFARRYHQCEFREALEIIAGGQ